MQKKEVTLAFRPGKQGQATNGLQPNKILYWAKALAEKLIRPCLKSGVTKGDVIFSPPEVVQQTLKLTASEKVFRNVAD